MTCPTPISQAWNPAPVASAPLTSAASLLHVSPAAIDVAGLDGPAAAAAASPLPGPFPLPLTFACEPRSPQIHTMVQLLADYLSAPLHNHHPLHLIVSAAVFGWENELILNSCYHHGHQEDQE